MTTNKLFNGESAKVMVKGLRETFSSGKTKSYAWRISQLRSILKFVRCHDEEILDALRSDLAKPDFESSIHEVYDISVPLEFMLVLYENRFR